MQRHARIGGAQPAGSRLPPASQASGFTVKFPCLRVDKDALRRGPMRWRTGAHLLDVAFLAVICQNERGRGRGRESAPPRRLETEGGELGNQRQSCWGDFRPGTLMKSEWMCRFCRLREDQQQDYKEGVTSRVPASKKHSCNTFVGLEAAVTSCDKPAFIWEARVWQTITRASRVPYHRHWQGLLRKTMCTTGQGRGWRVLQCPSKLL